MCGIAGIWLRSGRPVDPELLERMGALLRHRGPDGGGLHVERGLGLVHRRLVVMDTSDASAQPMSTPDGALWLNYNGEIHNYLELRRELEAHGVRFRSSGDTEVVLWAFRVWGARCFERFNGMWAAAFWEPARQRLLLSRDRFGIKPLVWSERGERVAFASEPKAILAAFPEERRADEREVHAFLSGAYPDGCETTFFANVRQVLPGEAVCFDAAGRRRERTWSYRPGREDPVPDAGERFRELLEDAVRLRMRSDVAVGSCLSGGLDSTAVVRLAARHAGGPMHCFSLTYRDDPRIDESDYARAAVGGSDRFLLHWVQPSPQGLVEVAERIVWHHDAPVPLRGRYAQWFVMQEAARHVKVVLDGQGSDEVLAGYTEFVLPWLLDRLLPRFATAGERARALVRLPRALRELAQLARVDRKPSTFVFRMLRTPAKRAAGLGRLPPEDLVPRPFARAFPRPAAARFGHVWGRRDVPRPYRSRLNNALWLQFRESGLPEVLHSEDALSMAFSVESRTPFLDHRLVELCFSLPYDEKIRGGWTKSVLRRGLADELPEPIRTRRRKLGLPAPVARWMADPANLPDVRETLAAGRLAARGWIRPERVASALSAPDAARFVSRRLPYLWRLLTLELWLGQFVDGADWPAAGRSGVERAAG